MFLDSPETLSCAQLAPDASRGWRSDTRRTAQAVRAARPGRRTAETASPALAWMTARDGPKSRGSRSRSFCRVDRVDEVRCKCWRSVQRRTGQSSAFLRAAADTLLLARRCIFAGFFPPFLPSFGPSSPIRLYILSHPFAPSRRPTTTLRKHRRPRLLTTRTGDSAVSAPLCRHRTRHGL